MTFDEFSSLLSSETSPFLTLSGPETEALFDHFRLLLQWNQRLNLTSIRDEREAVLRHYCESLFLATYLPLDGATVVDIGSGGGFPGVPAAIIRPGLSFTLVESHQRKSVFLRESTRSIKNVRVFNRRAEELSETFDWCISRGVSVEDLSGPLSQVARRYAILGGEDFFPTPQEAYRLPWGDRRFLHIGDVPRGTSGS